MWLGKERYVAVATETMPQWKEKALENIKELLLAEYPQAVALIVQEAVAKEREACALLIESMAKEPISHMGIAKLIRKRGE